MQGKEILSDNVLYYVTNGSGEITDLILYDVTSDGKQFGIIVSKEEIYGSDGTAEEPTATTYNYIINGLSGTATVSGNEFWQVITVLRTSSSEMISLSMLALTSVSLIISAMVQLQAEARSMT